MLLRRWHARWRYRQGLADLARFNERTLLDMGVDPDTLRAEATKPFWRA